MRGLTVHGGLLTISCEPFHIRYYWDDDRDDGSKKQTKSVVAAVAGQIIEGGKSERARASLITLQKGEAFKADNVMKTSAIDLIVAMLFAAASVIAFIGRTSPLSALGLALIAFGLLVDGLVISRISNVGLPTDIRVIFGQEGGTLERAMHIARLMIYLIGLSLMVAAFWLSIGSR